jgi:hypothetical protein
MDQNPSDTDSVNGTICFCTWTARSIFNILLLRLLLLCLLALAEIFGVVRADGVFVLRRLGGKVQSYAGHRECSVLASRWLAGLWCTAGFAATAVFTTFATT